MIERLRQNRDLPDGEFIRLLETDEYDPLLFEAADQVRREVYGTDVYIRGLIEFTNHCKNNCYYCGIGRSNTKLERYRLSGEDILACCDVGYGLGLRTFVLQGGEDPWYTDKTLCGIISDIKAKYPDCAVTLSLGERPYESLKALFDAGADRYLLRHETADHEHYRLLHPDEMNLQGRVECLRNIKKIGYQTGSGFMIGSPGQTTGHILKDIRFLQELRPEMIGIGPYIPHRDTPFAGAESGSLSLTLRLIAILRLMHPRALIPATTSLGTVSPDGRRLGLQVGANVLMPNLSPRGVRKHYSLYDNKPHTGDEAAEGRIYVDKLVEAAGYRIAVHRGDVKI